MNTLLTGRQRLGTPEWAHPGLAVRRRSVRHPVHGGRHDARPGRLHLFPVL